MTIKHRNHIPEKLRNTFSKIHQLIDQKKFIKGSFYFLRNKCGKNNCKCTKGEKHISLYIQKNLKGKIKKKLIPKRKWEEVKEMNNRYKDIINLLEEISDYEWEHIKD